MSEKILREALAKIDAYFKREVRHDNNCTCGADDYPNHGPSGCYIHDTLAVTGRALGAVPEGAGKGHQIIEIPASEGLDPITVILKDHSPGRGEITITCYGEAWTNFWGAIGKDRGIREFFLSCETDYLLTKLGAPQEPWTERDAKEYGIESESELADIKVAHEKWQARNAYITRIIDAVRKALQERAGLAGAGEAGEGV